MSTRFRSWARHHPTAAQAALLVLALALVGVGLALKVGKHPNGFLAVAAAALALAVLPLVVAAVSEWIRNFTVVPPAEPPRPPPGQTVFVGRTDQVEQLVTLITVPQQPESMVVFGLAGIGKSALCRQVIKDARVKERYGEARAWVNCEEATSSKELLSLIARQVGHPDETKRALEKTLLTWLDGRDFVLVLDNLETPLYSDDAAVKSLVGRLVAKSRLALLASLRTGSAPSEADLPLSPVEVPALTHEQGRELFGHIAPGPLTDKMTSVLEGLGGMPLAIELLALRAQASSAEERERLPDVFAQTREEVLKRSGAPVDPHTASVAASVELSLTSPLMTKPAKELMALLAWLPAGIAWSDLQRLSTPNQEAAKTLDDVGLASKAGDRLLTLPPIREHLATVLQATPAARLSVFELYHELLWSAHEKEPAQRAVIEAANIERVIADQAKSPEHRIDLLLREGDLQLHAGAITRATATFQKAADLARTRGDYERLARAALGVSGGTDDSIVTLDWWDAERIGLLREARKLLLAQGGSPLLKLQLNQRLLRELHLVATEQARDESEVLRVESRELLSTISDPKLALETILDQAKDASPRDTPPEHRLLHLDNALSLATEIGDRAKQFEAHWARTVALLEASRSDEAIRELARCEELVGEAGDPGRMRRTQQARRTTAIFSGRLDAVDGFWNDEQLEADKAGQDRDRRQVLHQRVFYCYYRGCLDSVVSEVRAMVDEREAIEMRNFGYHRPEQLALNDYQWWPTWRANLALVLVRTDPAGTREALQSLGTKQFADILPGEYWLYVMGVLAIALTEVFDPANDGEHADALCAILENYRDRCLVSWGLTMNFGSVEAVLGALRAKQRQWDKAFPQLDAGLAKNRSIGAQPEIVRALINRAEAHHARAAPGDESACVADAGEALALTRTIGMPPFQERANALLAARD